MKKYLLIDGNSVLYRVYYATYKQNLTTKDGIPTGCINGFIRVLENLLLSITPDKIFIAFDAGKTTFRTEKYGDYKAKRPSMPKDLFLQLQPIKDYLNLRKILNFKLANYEADDLIGTVQNKILKEDSDSKIFIVSSDKDLMQLVNKNTTFLKVNSGFKNLEEYTHENFSSKFFNLQPNQVPDFKAISGDSSDNIPGIKGMGPKQASDLLQKYGSIEKIYENLDKLSERTFKLLLENNVHPKEWKELSTIYCNSPLEINLEDGKVNYLMTDHQFKDICDFCEKYEMKALKTYFETQKESFQEVIIVDIGSKAIKLDGFIKFKNKHYRLFQDNYTINLIEFKENDALTNEGLNILTNTLETVNKKYFINDLNNLKNKKIYFFGTECLRKCSNIDEILRHIKKICNIDIDIISSEEECQLNYNAFKSIAKSMFENLLVVDVGGGSVELIEINASGKKNFGISLPIGFLIIKQKFITKNNEINTDTYDNIYNFFIEEFKKLNINKNLVFISGSGALWSVLQVIKYFNPRTNNQKDFFTINQCKETFQKLLPYTLENLLKIEELDKSRLDIIKICFVFLNALNNHFKIEHFIVADTNIRDGYLHKKEL